MTKPYTIPRSMTPAQFAEAIQVRPAKILTSNSKLAKDGIHNVSFPAYKASVVMNGKLTEYKTCPSAGVCKSFCYASQSTYLFRLSMVKHTRNLQYLIDDPVGFVNQLNAEIASKRNLKAVRIHDSGDWSSNFHWNALRKVMLDNPKVRFYCYTKMVSFMREKAMHGEIPANFTYVFSYGGTEDHLINHETDRHARIFNSRRELREAGYTEAYNSDIPASNPKTMRVGLITHGNHLAMNRLKRIVGKMKAPTSLDITHLAEAV
jgi:hypothetical protein